MVNFISGYGLHRYNLQSREGINVISMYCAFSPSKSCLCYAVMICVCVCVCVKKSETISTN